ncbi:AAA family ATPase [Kocuria rhizosphaericola]|uniref:AAA family ATPase n=1 Tax=Kocuria rhizosphaericola TaxID=3376284 RepID=UPI0037B3E50E
MLVVLVGLPGSGKTTLSSWLAQHAGIVVASRDAIRAAMFPQCLYTDMEKHAAYAGMKQAVSIMLSQGMSVCTDGITFSDQRQRQEMLEIADSVGAIGVVVHCACPIWLAQDRILRDTVTVFPDRTADLVRKVADRFDPIPPEAFQLDMTKSVKELGASLVEHLEQEMNR